jgi:hypothetical protein
MYTIDPEIKAQIKKKYINNSKVLTLLSENSFVSLLEELSKDENDEETLDLIIKLQEDYDDYIKGNRINLFNDHIRINEVS